MLRDSYDLKMREALIDMAREEYGTIRPCDFKTFDECFTKHGNKLLFWFNSPDNSTRVLSVEMEESNV